MNPENMDMNVMHKAEAAKNKSETFDLDDIQMVPLNMNIMPMHHMPMFGKQPNEMHMHQHEDHEMDTNNFPMVQAGMDYNFEMDISNAPRSSFDDLQGPEQFTDFDSDPEYRVYGDIDDVLRNIEQYNPDIFRRLASYGFPYNVSKNIVRRIIRLTLNYYR